MVNSKPIPKKLNEIEQYMEERVGLNVSFDLGLRKIQLLKKDVHLYYINGLCDTNFIIHIMDELLSINDHEKLTSNVIKIIENRIIHQSVEMVSTLDEMVDQVLSGLIAIIIEGDEKAIIVDTRSYPGRQPEEPDTEKVVRGSR